MAEQAPRPSLRERLKNKRLEEAVDKGIVVDLIGESSLPLVEVNNKKFREPRENHENNFSERTNSREIVPIFFREPTIEERLGAIEEIFADEIAQFGGDGPEVLETQVKKVIPAYEKDTPDTDSTREYFREISRYPLLNQEQEVALAKKIADARLREEDAIEFEDEPRLIKAQEEKEAYMKQFANHNLRLVVSIAKKYQNRGLSFLDLIQEGNLGLMKGVEKFDHTKGFKFSTYGTWWIRQSIARAIHDKGRIIRVPVHMGEDIMKMRKAYAFLSQEFGREPNDQEVAEHIGFSQEKYEQTKKASSNILSLNMKVGTEEETELGDLIPDSKDVGVDAEAINMAFSSSISEALDTLTERERIVIDMRYGLDDGTIKTLEQVGKLMGVSRERIRQIENKALLKLRNPDTLQKLDENSNERKRKSSGKATSNRKVRGEDGLTIRERNILDLLSKGYSRKQIAENLNVSLGTVNTTISGHKGLYRKFGISNKEEILQAASQNKLVKEDSGEEITVYSHLVYGSDYEAS